VRCRLLDVLLPCQGTSQPALRAHLALSYCLPCRPYDACCSLVFL
jgi:hypothetical protein